MLWIDVRDHAGDSRLPIVHKNLEDGRVEEAVQLELADPVVFAFGSTRVVESFEVHSLTLYNDRMVFSIQTSMG
jgi:hypothetical protein